MKVILTRKWFTSLTIIFAFIITLMGLFTIKLCVNKNIFLEECITLTNQLILIGNIFFVIGIFFIFGDKEVSDWKEDFKLFLEKIGLNLSKENKKIESIIFGSFISVLMYFILYANPQSKSVDFFPMFLKFLSAIILAPITEEIFYRGIIILGGFNLVIFLQSKIKKEWFKTSEYDFILLGLMIISALYFGIGHNNPRATIKGLIYGFLFLYRKNILLPWSAHVTNNLLAFVFELEILEYPF